MLLVLDPKISVLHALPDYIRMKSDFTITCDGRHKEVKNDFHRTLNMTSTNFHPSTRGEHGHVPRADYSESIFSNSPDPDCRMQNAITGSGRPAAIRPS